MYIYTNVFHMVENKKKTRGTKAVLDLLTAIGNPGKDKVKFANFFSVML